jgi:hypothetical protein
LITRIIFVEEYKLWSYSLCKLLQSPVISSLLGPNVFVSILFSNTVRLRSSLSVRGQVSDLYKTTGKLIVLYILVCILLESKLENKRFWAEW